MELSALNGEAVKKLNLSQKKALAEEIRGEIIKSISENGGHLSSNLGVVETTLALHCHFKFPKDKIIFDVGHQCYTHKILSGRADKFATIRTKGGISGFPCAEESEYDSFTTGHAGASLSSALGLCRSRDLQGEDYFVVAFVGDGSIVNGLNLEAMTQSREKPKKLIVVLNDNEMSISKNVNGLYKLISKGTIKRGYVKSKNALKRVFKNSFVTKFLRKVRNLIKRIFGGNNYFEQFGFKYVGAIDGNDLKELDKILPRVKIIAQNKAVLLHVKTTKGKGYDQAEEHSDAYHGVGKDLVSGKCVFSTALGEKLSELIGVDKKVVAITAGMKDGTGLDVVEELYPKNFIDVGIAEEYAVTFSAGLAKGGLKPVVCVYSTFLQRAYDQILHDVCLQKLPVVFCIDRAGFVGADGQTHQGVFDLSYLMHIPNLTILAPSTSDELKDALEYALNLNVPVAIRYPNEKCVSDRKAKPFDGKWEEIKKGDDITVLAVGPRMVDLALRVSENYKKSVGVVSARVIKPLDYECLEKIKNTKIITLEENSVIGGFGASVKCVLENARVKTLGVKDEFVAHASVSEQLEDNGLNFQALVKTINEMK